MTTNKTPAYLSVLMAGLLAAGAHAQSTSASGSSDLPPKAGEASTQTQGVPNAQTTNSTASETPAMSKDQIRQDAQGRNTASGTTSVPGKAGEASTMVQGKPNADKQVTARTREEVRAELLASRKNYQDNLRAKRNPDQRLGVMGASGEATKPSN
jgi:cytoskeletal protein RodZ